MATFTVSGSSIMGNKRAVWGTFTTSSGDTSVQITSSTTGINAVADKKISLDTGGIAHQNPKISVSGGTITATFDDTQGYSGTFWVLGS